MKVAILGAGAIGFASAAILAANGHQPILWSPSGRRTADLARGARLTATGAIAGEWRVSTAGDIGEALSDADAVLLAVDANGHRAVMEAAAPHVQPGQTFLIGAAHALSALWLSKAIAARDVKAPIVSWSTSLATAHQDDLTCVTIRSVRPAIDASVIGDAQAALALCTKLVSSRFTLRANAIEIGLLANCNPVFHVPVALLNLTRIEQKEVWATYQQTTNSVGRFIEALDGERVAIGKSFGADIHSVNEHFHRSFKIPLDSMTAMNQALHASGRGPKGATSTTHRHLRQDIPYGLVFASELARISGTPAPVHDAAITLASASLAQDFAAEAPLAQLFENKVMTQSQILTFAAKGF